MRRYPAFRPVLIDTHCHLNSESHFPDPDADVLLAQKAGVERLIVVGTDPSDGEKARSIAERHPHVYFIVGFHPNYCAEYSSANLRTLRPLLSHPKCVALGEIGLDYHWDYAPRAIQFQALEEQLDLAAELSKPVVFHCREAYPDLLGFLEARPAQPYLIHCFAGDGNDTRRALDLGCLFGVDGPVTYKKSEALRENMRTIGLGRIVLETDSPYLSPEPHRGKPNHPANIPLINAALSSCLGVTAEECAQRTSANALKFFGIE